MFETVKIAPSILSADFMNMERAIRGLDQDGADFVHVDVMDGHFVPNITLGVPFVEHLKKISNLALDVHLMVSNPLVQIPWFLEAGADVLTIHIEALDASTGEVDQALEMIRSAGVHPALALKPATPLKLIEPFIEAVDMVLVMSVNPGFSGQSFIEGSEDRVAEVVNLARKAGASPLIEVDGGIGVSTVGRVAAAGADVFVAGNAVFGVLDQAGAIKAITDTARQAQSGR